MTFANLGILLAGAGLIAVPILLHFLMQQKPKHLVFPALRFLQARKASNQRKLQLRHFLLLLLRGLIVLALAAALAKPAAASALFGAWLTLGGIAASLVLVALLLAAVLLLTRPIQRPLAGILLALLLMHVIGGGWLLARTVTQGAQVTIANRDAPVAALLIFDNGPRMGLVYENETRLEQARQFGDWLLGELPRESRVAILETASNVGFFSVDISAARKRMKTLDVQYDARPVTEIIEQALELASDTDLPQKEIYVLTDLTAPTWLDAASGQLRQALEQRPDIAVYVIDVGVKDPSNLSLGDLQLRSETLSQNGRLQVAGELRGTGASSGAREVEMYVEKPDPRRPFTLDGVTQVPEEHWVRQTTLELSEGGGATFQFELGGLPTGVHHGWVQVVGSDNLPFDDRRYFTVEVQGRWQSLLVTGPEVSATNVNELLSPYAFRRSGQAMFDTQVVGQDELSRERLDSYDVVFLLDPAPLSEAAWNLLTSYVEQGGGLFVMLGHNAMLAGGQPDATFNESAAQQLLPGSLTTVWRGRDGDIFVDPQDFSHEVMAPFRQVRSTIPWSTYPVHRHWGLQASGGESSQSAVRVVTRLSNGIPFMVERQVGEGRVLTMTTPYTEPLQPEGRRRWNDFSNPECWPAWLLVKQASEYLVRAREKRLNYTVAEQVVLDNEGDQYPAVYQLFPPDPEEPPRQVTAREQTLRFKFTDRPGPYRLKGEKRQIVRRGFSVNVPQSESLLDRVTTEELDEIFGADRYQLADSVEGLAREQGVMRRGQEFYPLLIVALVLCLALEHLLANRFYSQTAAPARSWLPLRLRRGASPR